MAHVRRRTEAAEVEESEWPCVQCSCSFSVNHLFSESVVIKVQQKVIGTKYLRKRFVNIFQNKCLTFTSSTR